MTDRPILFSAAMVRALLAGTKTQTRRIVKPQPPAGHNWVGFTMSSTCRADEGKATWGRGDTTALIHDAHRVRCPYGEVGDRLWVRESGMMDRDEKRFFAYSATPGTCKEMTTGGVDERCKLDAINSKTLPGWRSVPSIHMPRWASRITLDITGIRVERLQEISEEDAKAEGLKQYGHGWEITLATEPKTGERICCTVPDPRVAYKALWESINGAASWTANPWVWVVEIRHLPTDGFENFKQFLQYEAAQA